MSDHMGNNQGIYHQDFCEGDEKCTDMDCSHCWDQDYDKCIDKDCPHCYYNSSSEESDECEIDDEEESEGEEKIEDKVKNIYIED